MKYLHMPKKSSSAVANLRTNIACTLAPLMTLAEANLQPAMATMIIYLVHKRSIKYQWIDSKEALSGILY